MSDFHQAGVLAEEYYSEATPACLLFKKISSFAKLLPNSPSDIR
jgi:hypothetical protein